MKLSDYFEQTQGRGVMSTADSSGHLTAAIYAKPHFMDEETVAFIMADRLTHKNLASNPHAVYLFMEAGEKYAGKRLYLTKTNEDQNSPLIDALRRRERYPLNEDYVKENKFLVSFKIDKVLPLIGGQ
ncbi:MAG TPA: pyridoxamine 5'-phosphate oxidase family protein [Anaerolineales bacterium]|nr:pyridoxamine 5'-phosphate oxidase family protein [Anaerolineales bacterium]